MMHSVPSTSDTLQINLKQTRFLGEALIRMLKENS
jgi:hypothetical protein